MKLRQEKLEHDFTGLVCFTINKIDTKTCQTSNAQE